MEGVVEEVLMRLGQVQVDLMKGVHLLMIPKMVALEVVILLKEDRVQVVLKGKDPEVLVEMKEVQVQAVPTRVDP